MRTSKRLWTGGGDGFRWSDAKNWSPQGVPGAGDDIKIENTSGSTLSVSNDIVGLSVAHILPGGTSAFSGEGVTVTGDGRSNRWGQTSGHSPLMQSRGSRARV